MRLFYGRRFVTPEALRGGVHAVRGLDGMPRAHEPMLTPFLPTGGAALVVARTPDQPLRVLVVGPRTRAKFRSVVPAPFFVQFRLAPGAARSLFGISMAELKDRWFRIEDVLGRAGHELVQRLIPHEGRTFDTMTELLPLLGSAERDPLVTAATHALDREAESPARLAKRLGVSERVLRSAFHDRIGISPKRYSRIARLRRVLREAGRASWTSLAAAHGFSDQAHLNAEFREQLGLTPTAFLALRAKTQ